MLFSGADSRPAARNVIRFRMGQHNDGVTMTVNVKEQGDATVTLEFMAIDLVEGTYKVDVAAHRQDGAPYDYHRLLHTFRVKSRTKDVGIYRPRHRWTFHGGVDHRRES